MKLVNNFKSIVLATMITSVALASDTEKPNPFAVNNGEVPSKKEYAGPLFKFNHSYPKEVQKIYPMPWQKVLNGKPLSKENAYEYIMTLKKHIQKPMKTFVNHPKEWNRSSQEGWYSMVWAGQEYEKTGWEGRDAIYGTYTGQIIPKHVYEAYGLTTDIRNHAAIYYDKRAAQALGQVWKNCSKAQGVCVPNVLNNEAQFPEGSIIIKSAGVTATPEQWPVLEGASKWQIYRKPFDLNGTIENAKPVVTDIRVGIFDIIVKDSKAAPETGWVFATLVYDKDAKGATPWDRMVPLGAMWGNDPKVNSAKNPQEELMENYINPKAPEYAKVTLGYGLRLSGPFDIAVKYNVEVDGKIVPELRSSSCLSCHATASYIPDNYHMTTFFYPAKEHKTMPWKMYTPGGDEWNEWFANRWGNVPQSKDPKAIALDYSTFLEAVLMNYASTLDTNNTNADAFAKWKVYRTLNQH